MYLPDGIHVQLSILVKTIKTIFGASLKIFISRHLKKAKRGSFLEKKTLKSSANIKLGRSLVSINQLFFAKLEQMEGNRNWKFNSIRIVEAINFKSRKKLGLLALS